MRLSIALALTIASSLVAAAPLGGKISKTTTSGANLSGLTGAAEGTGDNTIQGGGFTNGVSSIQTSQVGQNTATFSGNLNAAVPGTSHSTSTNTLSGGASDVNQQTSVLNTQTVGANAWDFGSETTAEGEADGNVVGGTSGTGTQTKTTLHF